MTKAIKWKTLLNTHIAYKEDNNEEEELQTTLIANLNMTYLATQRSLYIRESTPEESFRNSVKSATNKLIPR